MTLRNATLLRITVLRVTVLRVTALLITMLILATAPAFAICWPLPCDTCNLRSAGQLNFIVFDRVGGRVTMIPSLRFQGQSPDFVLVVPTPALPTLAETDGRIWQDAAELTARVRVGSGDSNDGFGCAQSFDSAVFSPESDGVIVHGMQTVGGMHAVILSSDDPDSLFLWLDENDYRLEAEDQEKLEPLVLEGWFFTAMRPDLDDPRNQMPLNGWDANPPAVRFTWSADHFEIPLGVLDINRASLLPVTFFVIDDHRAAVEGATTEYANRISQSEYDAIRQRQPFVAQELAPGRMLTRLRRNFTDADRMEGRLAIERAPNDDEFRLVTVSTLSLDLALLAAACGLTAWRGRRARRANTGSGPGYTPACHFSD